MNRDEMLQKLMALDFFILDLHLYLDTHPTDRDAITKYNAAVKEGKEIREQYEQQFGMLSSQFSTSKYPWQWIDDPWPWQAKFNFNMTGDER